MVRGLGRHLAGWHIVGDGVVVVVRRTGTVVVSELFGPSPLVGVRKFTRCAIDSR